MCLRDRYKLHVVDLLETYSRVGPQQALVHGAEGLGGGDTELQTLAVVRSQ